MEPKEREKLKTFQFISRSNITSCPVLKSINLLAIAPVTNNIYSVFSCTIVVALMYYFQRFFFNCMHLVFCSMESKFSSCNNIIIFLRYRIETYNLKLIIYKLISFLKESNISVENVLLMYLVVCPVCIICFALKCT